MARRPTSPTSARWTGRRPRSARHSRTRGSASTRSRPTTSRRSWRRSTARGFGANVVSRGEWAIARRAGVPNGRITLEGVGKTDADLREAVRASASGNAPLMWVALESADEAEVLTRMARRAGLGTGGRPPLDVLVRLNPDVVPDTIAELAVGEGASKFGMTETEATALVEWLGSHGGGALRPRGIHLHVGSQLRAVDAWRDAVRRGAGGRRPAPRRARGVRHARRRRRLPGHAARRVGARIRSGSRARSRRCSPRCPRTAARPGWRSSPVGRSSPGPAGSWRASSTSASAAGARSSSTPG